MQILNELVSQMNASFNMCITFPVRALQHLFRELKQCHVTQVSNHKRQVVGNQCEIFLYEKHFSAILCQQADNAKEMRFLFSIILSQNKKLLFCNEYQTSLSGRHVVCTYVHKQLVHDVMTTGLLYPEPTVMEKNKFCS